MNDYIRGTKEQRGMMIWNDRMLDDPISALKAEAQSTKYNGIVYVEHTWQQLKRSMEWYERQCNLCGYNQEVILREINLQRLAGSSLCPFTREQQLYLSTHIHKPVEEIDVRSKDTMSTINIYEKFDRRIPYIIGIDPAEGLSEDNNAMIVINPFTYKIAAEYKCPYISPKEFAKLITGFMDQRCPHALLVVESNRGRDLIQRLTDSHYASRVWYDKDRMNQILTEKTDRYGGIPQSVLARKVQGFVTGPKSRNLLFSCLEQMVMENIDCIFSKNLVNEMLTLIRKPTTGKIEAAPGEHDDCVMAYLIGLYVYLNASNLGEYGISRHMRRPDEKVEKTVESERQYRDRVKAAINVLPEQYRGIFEDFVRERDPITDAHQYAKDLRKAERDDPFNQLKMTRHRTMEVDEDQISLDKYMGRDGTQKVPEPKVGMEYFKMGETLQTPHYNYGRRDDALYIGDEPDDTLGEEERFTFEQGILDMNRPHEDEYGYPSYEDDDGFTFDPNDYA